MTRLSYFYLLLFKALDYNYYNKNTCMFFIVMYVFK